MLAVDSVTIATIAAPIFALIVGIVASEMRSRIRGRQVAEKEADEKRDRAEAETKESLQNLTNAVLGTRATAWSPRIPGLQEEITTVKQRQTSMQEDISTLMDRSHTLVPNGGETSSISDRVERTESKVDAMARHLGLEDQGEDSDS